MKPAAKPTFIVAEAGVNHNGDIDRAIRMIDGAVEAGADAVKFQTFRADALVTAAAPKAAYQRQTTGGHEGQREMLRRLELNVDAHHKLAERCRASGIEFLSTPFDLESLNLLLELNVKTVKIASGEIVNGPLLLKAAMAGKRILLSTGMSTMQEIREALGVIAFGYIGLQSQPSRMAFGEALAQPAGAAAIRDRVTVLQCTTQYPAPLADINLSAMRVIGEAFGTAVGLSDHSCGIAVPIAAAALGATVIEKHFTLSRDLPGPDHRASLELPELKAMVNGIRDVEKALGNGQKMPAASELEMRQLARKSLVAARDIAPGDLFSAENVTAKRPGTGLSPMEYWNVVGSVSDRPYKTDDPLQHRPVRVV